MVHPKKSQVDAYIKNGKKVKMPAKEFGSIERHMRKPFVSQK